MSRYWYVMKTRLSYPKPDRRYVRHYHNTARPLQPLNGRPVTGTPMNMCHNRVIAKKENLSG